MMIRTKLLLLGILLISCGKEETNTVHLQEPLKEDQPFEGPKEQPKGPISGVGCTYAKDKQELITVFEDNLLPKETFTHFYYTEKKCGDFKFLFFKGNSCTTKSGLGPREPRGNGIRHEMASTRELLADKIVDRIKKSTPHEISLNGSQHRIIDHKTGAIWHLDLCFPLIAQPTYKLFIDNLVSNATSGIVANCKFDSNKFECQYGNKCYKGIDTKKDGLDNRSLKRLKEKLKNHHKVSGITYKSKRNQNWWGQGKKFSPCSDIGHLGATYYFESDN